MLNKDLNDKRDKIEHDISGVFSLLILFITLFVVFWIAGGW